MFPPERLFAQAGKKVSGMIRDKKMNVEREQPSDSRRTS
jgi:hypothetical protein